MMLILQALPHKPRVFLKLERSLLKSAHSLACINRKIVDGIVSEFYKTTVRKLSQVLCNICMLKFNIGRFIVFVMLGNGISSSVFLSLTLTNISL